MCVCLCVWVCELNIDRGWHSWCFEEVYVGCLKATCLCLCVCVFVCVCVCVSVCVLYIERLVWLMRLSRLFWAAVCVCVCVCGFWVHEKFRIVHAFRFCMFDRWVFVCVCVCTSLSMYFCVQGRGKRECVHMCVQYIYTYVCTYVCSIHTYIYIIHAWGMTCSRVTQISRDWFTCNSFVTHSRVHAYVRIYIYVYISFVTYSRLIRDSFNSSGTLDV